MVLCWLFKVWMALSTRYPVDKFIHPSNIRGLLAFRELHQRKLNENFDEHTRSNGQIAPYFMLYFIPYFTGHINEIR